MNTQLTIISSQSSHFYGPGGGGRVPAGPVNGCLRVPGRGDGAVDVPVDTDLLAFFRDDAGERSTNPQVTITVVDVDTEAPIEGRIHRNEMVSGLDNASPVNQQIWRPDMPFERTFLCHDDPARNSK